MPGSMRGVHKSYGALKVLDGLDADFPEGTVSVILGPTGCGKTTILNILAGLVMPERGEVTGFAGRRFSYAFQEPRLLPWLDARGNILFALSGLRDPGLAAARADRFLAASGLAEAAGRRPPELSGGMRRRLSLARAFAYPADVLLLDEAFSAVDLKVRLELMDLFMALWKEEKPTVIMVTHDIQEAIHLADRVLVMSARPASILDDLRFPRPHEDRVFGSGIEITAEARLYDLVLGRAV